MTFLMKTPETKKVWSDFLRGISDFYKSILLKPSRTYFHFYKKGSLNPQAVRIRVCNYNQQCS
jgi:hypothetical protein